MMNYYELIYLKQNLKNKLIGGLLEEANTPYRNFLECFIVKSESRCRLLFSVDAGNIALFTDSYRGGKKTNTTNFFERIYGKEIVDITIPETDRWLSVHFENQYSLTFRLFSSKANAILTKGDTILSAFKDYDKEGDKIPSPKKINLFEGNISGKSLKNKILTLNPMFPREHIPELINFHELGEKSDEEIKEFVKECDEQMRNNPEFRLLETGDTTLLSENILPIKSRKTFAEVNELIAYRYKNYSQDQRLKNQKKDLLLKLESGIKKLRSLKNNLEQRRGDLNKAEEYEQRGHLLMANAHEQVTGDEIELENLFKDGEKEIIKLPKKDAGLAENAQHYYKKAQNVKQAYEQAQKELPKVQEELENYIALKKQVDEIHDLWEYQDWEKEHKAQLNEILGSSQKTEAQDLPFFVFEIQNYTVWIGKNAKSNDKLLQAAHKEDVWMHARGVPGSHLIIRMGNEKNMPPMEILLKAASFAAYNSKAKGSDLVPVIITKAKYVRKPKGAAPGAVLVDKEQVEMVKPEKPSKT